MKTLDALKESFGNLLVDLRRMGFARMLARKGVRLSSGEVDRIMREIDSGSRDVQVGGTRLKLTRDDLSYARECLRETLETMTSVVSARFSPNDLADRVAEWVQKDAARSAASRAREMEVWGRPLEHVAYLIEFMSELRPPLIAGIRRHQPMDERALPDALCSIHSRACEIAEEIVALLSKGFVCGAWARWRSLHELAVHAVFLAKYGYRTAGRYLAHIDVQRRDWIRAHDAQCQKWGMERIPSSARAMCEASVKEHLKKYGSEFEKDYGWAAEALGEKKANFRKVEESIDQSRWRPYYRLASQHIHGVTESLAFFEHGGHDTHLPDWVRTVAGPARICVESGFLITAALCMMSPIIDDLFVLVIVRAFCDQTVGLLDEAESLASGGTLSIDGDA